MPVIRVFLLALAGMLFSGLAVAQTDSRFDAFMQTVSGNKTTITFGSGGTPVATSSAPLGTASVQGMGFSRTAEGVFMESNGVARLPGGRSTVPVSTKLKLSAPVVGKALGRALLVYSAWEAGSALYDIWADVGLQIDSSGNVSDPAASSAVVSDGYWWGIGSIRRYSKISACQAYTSALSYYYVGITEGTQGADGVYTTNPTCRWKYSSTSQTVYSTSMERYIATACPVGWYISGESCSETNPAAPMTEQQVADVIAQQSGWPDSTIASAMADAVRLPGVGPYIAPDVEALPETETRTQIQGVPQGTPVQVGDPVTTEETTQNPDGTTTTKTSTTTTEVVADGNELTQRQTTSTTTTVKDGTGAVISTTTGTATTDKTATTPAPTEVIVCGLPDTPPCAIDETGTPGKPEVDAMQIDKAADEWNQQMEELKDTVTGPDDKGFLDGWRDFFVTPPLAECAPFELPGDRGVIDPCPVVGSVRSIMAYIWALTGLYLCLGMVRQSIVGGG